MRISGITCAMALCVGAALAQPVSRQEPAQFTSTGSTARVESRPPGIRLSLRKPREIALPPLSGSETARLAEPGTRLKAGIHRRLPIDVRSLGAWETTAEGTRVWRMALRSPESAGIRVEFRGFAVGGGKVWLHNGDQTVGPYTGRGLYDDGHFWSATIFSDSAIVEYEPDPAAPNELTPPFEIDAVSHYAAPRAAPAATADACHLDPNCYADWKPAMSMVAQLVYEEDGVKYVCSGSLVGTRDNSFKPYLLTAGHCIHSEAAARSLEVFWTYQTSSCGAPAPADRSASTKSSLGAHLIDFGSIGEGDFSLVLLKDVPSGVTFAGWDVSDPAMTSSLAGIHHPKGSWKRISFGERIADQTILLDGSLAPANRYLSVLWGKGVTEPGSSGSPLFSSPGVIVGLLTYGPASPTATACEISPNIDGYGRFSTAYPRIKDYLENLPAAIVTGDRTEVSFVVADRAAPPEQTVRLSAQSKGQIAYKLRADAPWIRLSSNVGEVPAELGISVDASQFDQPGRYSGTVTILSGAAPPQFINVTATVAQNQSDVQASIAPNPVTESGGVWSFRIRLAESRNAGTRLTGLKLNGTDYSARIKDWFGSDRIDANGAIEAPLQTSGRWPQGAQYFEFSGIDDFSGQRWYRVAPVDFR